MTQQVLQFAEFAGPLLAGLLFGVLYKRYVFPKVFAKVFARAEPLARLVLTRGNRVASFILSILFLGLALACHSTNAPAALAWLQAHPVVSAELAPTLLRIVSMAAALLGGCCLTVIPTQDYVEELLSRRSSPHTTNDAPPPQPTPPRRREPLTPVVLILGMTGVAVYFVGSQKGGFLRTSDVGGLAELASIQEQLMPLNACEMTYRAYDSRGIPRYPGKVFLTPCGSSSSSSIRVPTTWDGKGVSFEMTRSSTSQRWKILVDKDEVAFPDLKEALEHFAPILAQQYPQQIQKALAEQDQRRREDQERKKAKEREAEERKERARTSYPE